MTEEQMPGTAGDTGPQSEPAPAMTPEEQIARVQEQLALAVSSYRRAVLARFPEVPEELVSGDTVEAVDTSLRAAQGIVEKVRVQLEARAAAERVPAGAPARSVPDVGALSPAEKIAYALSRSP